MSRFWLWLNGPQKKWSSGKSNADAPILRILRGDHEALQRVVAGQPGDHALERLVIAAQDPQDRGVGVRLPARPLLLGTVQPEPEPGHRRGSVIARVPVRRLRRVG